MQTVWLWNAGGVHGTIHFHGQQSCGLGLTAKKTSQPQQFTGITATPRQHVHNGCRMAVSGKIDIAPKADQLHGHTDHGSFLMQISQQSFDTTKRANKRIEDEYFQRRFRQTE